MIAVPRSTASSAHGSVYTGRGLSVCNVENDSETKAALFGCRRGSGPGEVYYADALGKCAGLWLGGV